MVEADTREILLLLLVFPVLSVRLIALLMSLYLCYNPTSTLTLPSGAYKPSNTPSKYTSKLTLDTLGIPQTSMSTIMVSSSHRSSSLPSSSGTSTSLLSRRPSVSPTPAHLLPTPTISVQFSAHTPPPKKLSSTAILVRIWAVALDAYDALAARDGSKGFIPGRAFVGKVLEWGEGVKGFSRGDLVYGLVGVKKSGALAEFVVVERRCLAHAPPIREDQGFGLEEIASLPLLGIPAHRAVGTVLRGSRALVLLGSGTSAATTISTSSSSSSPSSSTPPSPAHSSSSAARPLVHQGSPDWAVGLLAAQELISRGVIVVLQVPPYLSEEWAREHVRGLRDGCVRLGESVEIVNGEHEGSFEFVLDCEGGRRIYDASRRIMATGGQYVDLLLLLGFFFSFTSLS